MQASHLNTSRRDWVTDVLFLTVLFLFFYLCWLGHYPVFTPDEGRYPEVAREMVMSGDYITPRVDGVAFLDKPILYYWLQAAAIHWFGVKEWALRLFPALFGILGCLFTYIGGRRLFNRRTGLISAVILSTSPLYFAGAHYANLDLEVAVLISCTLICFITGVQATDRSRPYFLFGAYIFAGLAFLTKGMIGVAFPCLIAGAWMALLWRWSLLKKIYLLPGLMIIAMITLPWYILVQRANPEFLHYFFVTQQVTRFLSAGVFNNKTPYWFYFPIVLAGFFPWTIFLIQALYKNIRDVLQARQEQAAPLFLLLWLVIIFTFFSIPHSKTIGYIFPIFPALALLVGHYVSTAWEHTRQKGIYIAAANFILIGGILAALLVALPRYNWIDFSPSFTPYLYIMATIFLISALVALVNARKKTLLPLVATCASCGAIFLLTLTMSASALNQNSAKPLVTYLKTIIKPNDEVATYFKYYQDVPLYLGQRVTIVADWNSPSIPLKDNWARELWYGKAFQNTDAWLIEENTFWTRWNSSKRVFAFVNVNYMSQFKEQAKHFYRLDSYNDITLVSNKIS